MFSACSEMWYWQKVPWYKKWAYAHIYLNWAGASLEALFWTPESPEYLEGILTLILCYHHDETLWGRVIYVLYFIYHNPSPQMFLYIFQLVTFVSSYRRMLMTSHPGTSMSVTSLWRRIWSLAMNMYGPSPGPPRSEICPISSGYVWYPFWCYGVCALAQFCKEK